MGYDSSEKCKPDDLFIGRMGSDHRYHQANNLVRISSGKKAMHDAVLDLVLDYALGNGERMRFMSLPGKFWRFEFELAQAFEIRRKLPVYFTGFERDNNVIVAGTGYVPRFFGRSRCIVGTSFRTLDSLGVSYFKTNRSRWFHFDVNSALTLNNSVFKGEFSSLKKHNSGKSWMEWWLNKFCRWDAVWLDYYGPISASIGKALANLYFHCANDVTPVAVTVLKGRETDGLSHEDRKDWISKKLSSGIGVEFETLDYTEYTEEGGVTMCNLIGLLNRL